MPQDTPSNSFQSRICGPALLPLMDLTPKSLIARTFAISIYSLYLISSQINPATSRFT